jgi:peptidylprolyl isomerase
MSNRVQGKRQVPSAAAKATAEARAAAEAEAAESAADEADDESADDTEDAETATEKTVAKKTSGKTASEPKELTRPEQRAMARKAAAKKVRSQRRKDLALGWTSGIVLLGVVAGIFVACTHNSAKKPAVAATTAASTAPSASAAPFPSLAPGIDKALAAPPTITAGTGTLSALKVTTLVPGNGVAVAAGATITVNYVGATYKDGKVFDASWQHGQTFSFVLGAGNVIPGWDQGLVGVKVGSRVQLDIPANLAYGENVDPSSGAPAGALRFIVDVLGTH